MTNLRDAKYEHINKMVIEGRADMVYMDSMAYQKAINDAENRGVYRTMWLYWKGFCTAAVIFSIGWIVLVILALMVR